MIAANPRSRARSWALQLLYAWDVSGAEDDLSDFAERALARRTISPRYRPYSVELIEALSRQFPAVDAKAQDTAQSIQSTAQPNTTSSATTYQFVGVTLNRPGFSGDRIN